MEIKRKIYKDLLAWKEKRTGRVLELEGARQAGKTFILRKFASENFGRVYYMNMAEMSGKDFLRCIEEAFRWSPGMERPKQPLHTALKMYSPDFRDSESEIVVIDEIQESAQVYNQIRNFSREFQCYVAVTGSYLGKTLQKDFFLPAGDTDHLEMGTLSFEEFLGAMGEEGLFLKTDAYGASEKENYEKLNQYFKIYERIGGYPAVVAEYAKSRNLQECDAIIGRIVDVFVNESKRYFTEITDVDIFTKLFHAIAVLMLREKQGIRDLTARLTKIIYQEESGRMTKRMVNHAISWLQESHIIGYASKSIDCDHLRVRENSRYYFLDLGIAYHFLRKTGEAYANVKGLLAENYVYLCLRERMMRTCEIAGNAPWFALYQKTKGELDFYVRSLLDYKNYGIEVKSSDEAAKTAHRLLEDGVIDYLYLLKGDTCGGISENGRILTMPLYFADRMEFGLGQD